MPRSPYNVSTGSKLIVTLYKHLIVPFLVHKAIMRLFFFKLQIDCCWILKGLGNVFKWFVIQSMVCIGVWTNSAKVLGTFSATFFFFFAHILPGCAEVNWQGRGVSPDRRMTLWIHSCMVTQCDSPDMAGNVRQLTESHLRLQATSKN